MESNECFHKLSWIRVVQDRVLWNAPELFYNQSISKCEHVFFACIILLQSCSHFDFPWTKASQPRLGMCIPSVRTSWSNTLETLIRYRLGHLMASHFPDVEIDADSVEAHEVIHRSQLKVDWAIIGLGRSGTTSLASWLGQHPRLQLLSSPSDQFREGAFDYLFRRSQLEHLVQMKRELMAEALGPRGIRSLRGIKEPNLLRSNRGRQILAEMKRTKVLIILKNLEWNYVPYLAILVKYHVVTCKVFDHIAWKWFVCWICELWLDFSKIHMTKITMPYLSARKNTQIDANSMSVSQYGFLIGVLLYSTCDTSQQFAANLLHKELGWLVEEQCFVFATKPVFSNQLSNVLWLLSEKLLKKYHAISPWQSQDRWNRKYLQLCLPWRSCLRVRGGFGTERIESTSMTSLGFKDSHNLVS